MNINIFLALSDIDCIKKYLNSGTGNIDDILIEITTQAEKILSRPYTISGIQTKVLQKLLNNQNIEYTKLLNNFYAANKIDMEDGVPHIDSLSYEEAIAIIKYANDKLGKV